MPGVYKSELDQCVEAYDSLEMRYRFSLDEQNLLAELTGLPAQRSLSHGRQEVRFTNDIKKLQTTIDEVTKILNDFKTHNVNIKWFLFLRTKDTRALKAALTYLNYHLQRIKDLHDPAAKHIPSSAQNIPPLTKPAALIEQLENLVGGFFRWLLNKGNAMTIEELRRTFMEKQKGWERYNNDLIIFTPQQLLRPGEKKSQRFTEKIEGNPKKVFEGYPQDNKKYNKENETQGIISHDQLLEEFEQLGIKEKICRTPKNDIDKVLEEDPNTDEETKVKIWQYVVKLKEQAKENQATPVETSLSHLNEPFKTDFAKMNNITTSELKLCLAFDRLTEQPPYMLNDKLSKSEKFVLYGENQYRNLDEIEEVVVKELVAIHREYISEAKKIVDTLLVYFAGWCTGEIGQENFENTLKLYAGIDVYLDSVIQQLMTTSVESDLRPPRDLNLINLKQKWNPFYIFLQKTQQIFQKCLDSPKDFLRVNEIVKLAKKNGKASKWLVEMGSPTMRKKAKPSKIGLLARKELKERVDKLGLEKKYENQRLSKEDLEEITWPETNKIKIVNSEVVKQVVASLVTDNVTSYKARDTGFVSQRVGYELSLYAVYTLLLDPEAYKKWRGTIQLKSDVYYKVETRIREQLLTEMKIYIQGVKQLDLDCLEQAKKEAEQYIHALMQEIINIQNGSVEGSGAKKGYNEEKYKNIQYTLYEIFVSIYEHRFGYPVKVAFSYKEKLGDEQFTAYVVKKSWPQGNGRLMTFANALFIMEMMMEEIDSCIAAINDPDKGPTSAYINQLLNLVQEEEAIAETAAEDCPPLVDVGNFPRGERKGKEPLPEPSSSIPAFLLKSSSSPLTSPETRLSQESAERPRSASMGGEPQASSSTVGGTGLTPRGQKNLFKEGLTRISNALKSKSVGELLRDSQGLADPPTKVGKKGRKPENVPSLNIKAIADTPSAPSPPPKLASSSSSDGTGTSDVPTEGSGVLVPTSPRYPNPVLADFFGSKGVLYTTPTERKSLPPEPTQTQEPETQKSQKQEPPGGR
jgi:hypothetical protein